MNSLELGEFTRLWRCSSGRGVFNVVALDHQDSLRRALNPSEPEVITRRDIQEFKRDVASELRDMMGGVLLDAPTGLPAVLPSGNTRQCGLLVAIERSDYALQPMPIELEIEPGWSVAKIAKLGADGVKLFVYDHPTQREISDKQDALIRQVATESQSLHLPLYSEPIVIMANPSDSFTERVISAAVRQQELGATILKLEFPQDIQTHPSQNDWRAACRDLSSAISIPWVLLSAGVDHSTFALQLEIACKSGASGFIVGRALWGEATSFSAREDRRAWLKNVAQPRFDFLSAIANRYARPWSEIYTKPNLSDDWYLKQ